MKPELGRTYLEVGRRLAGTGQQFDGATPEACLDRARTIFSELGLEDELARSSLTFT